MVTTIFYRNTTCITKFVVPGILGTRLEAKLDRDWVPHYICSKQADWFTIWMNYEIIAPLGGTCWADNLKDWIHIFDRLLQ